MFKIKKNLAYSNKEFLKILNIYNQYKNINSIKFILDNENNLYFIINNNTDYLFYNYKLLNKELFNYLFNYEYLSNLDIININHINIELDKTNIIYLNKFNNENEIKRLKENIKETLLKEI